MQKQGGSQEGAFDSRFIMAASPGSGYPKASNTGLSLFDLDQRQLRVAVSNVQDQLGFPMKFVLC